MTARSWTELIANPWVMSEAPAGARSARGPSGATLYAPDEQVLAEVGWPAGDYAARYWALRANLGLGEDIRMLAEALGAARWEAFAQRRLKRRVIHLHLLFCWPDGSGGWALIDRGEGTVFGLGAALRYAALDAKRRGGALLLIVSHRAFRRWALLALARMTGEALSALAAGREALTQGERARWERLGTDWAAQPVAGLPRLPAPGRPKGVRQRKGAPPSLTPPTWFAALEAYERLPQGAREAFRYLAWHPLLDAPCLATFLDVGEAEAAGHLEALARAGLAEEHAEGWAISTGGARMLAQREGLGDFARRHEAWLRELRRRAGHTQAVHRFFARLKRDLDRRARATRALPDGRPYYEWGAYECELGAAQSYLSDGRVRTHRPDGYGALRAGERWTRFFLEVDGWLDAQGRVGGRSMCSIAVWREKLARRAHYRAAGWWALRYPAFPRLLVVTTDARNLALIAGALAEQGTGEAVYVALAEDVARAGPTARIWRAVDARGVGEVGYPFDDFDQPGVIRRAREADALEALARANALRAAAAAWALGKR